MRSFEDNPVHRLWVAAGRQVPREYDGSAVEPVLREPAVCALTGGPAHYLWDQAFSDNFTSLRAIGTAFPFASLSAGRRPASVRPWSALSAAVVWAAKTLALRCATWVLEPADAGHDVLEFWPLYRPPGDPARARVWRRTWGDRDPRAWLDWLLRPRPAGTVAALPATGIKHGGETQLHRCGWPGVGHRALTAVRPVTHEVVADPLVRVQSKHVAIFARSALQRGVLSLQVDSEPAVEVDTERWRAALVTVRRVATDVRVLGVPAPAIHHGLMTLALEVRSPVAAHARFASLLHGLGDLLGHPFWPLFVRGIHV